MSRRLDIAALLNPEAVAQTGSVPGLQSVLSGQPAGRVGMDDRIISVRTAVKLNRKTTLAKLYTYRPGTSIEYPETGTDDGETIGHLFHIDPLSWKRPSGDIVYSQGPPKGKSKPGEEVSIEVLVDNVTGEEVMCVKRHKTCM